MRDSRVVSQASAPLSNRELAGRMMETVRVIAKEIGAVG